MSADHNAPPHKNPTPPEYPADRARGGEIVLKRRWQRLVFGAGLAAIVVVVLILQMISLSGS